MKCYLLDAGAFDYSDAVEYPSIKEAKEAYVKDAKKVENYCALIHLRDERQHDEPKLCADASYFLSLGPRGGLRCENT